APYESNSGSREAPVANPQSTPPSPLADPTATPLPEPTPIPHSLRSPSLYTAIHTPAVPLAPGDPTTPSGPSGPRAPNATAPSLSRIILTPASPDPIATPADSPA